MDNILEKLQNQWNSDGVRILVLTSLSIQIGLTFLAPFRKRNPNKVLMLTIWVLYLTADVVPPLALGNMGKQIGPAESGDLTILWASFLLLHLGGPDNITSYSIDDNELWWRLPLGLVVQVGTAVYTFWQSPPNPVLWIPTTLVCIAGMIKFVERTLALRSGSRNNIKDTIMMEISPVNDTKKVDELVEAIRKYKELVEAIWKYKDEGEREMKDESISEHGAGAANETKVEKLVEDIKEKEKAKRKMMVKFGSLYALTEALEATSSERESTAIVEGYFWFDIFKRLLVDVTFSSNLLKYSQDRFSVIDRREAINFITIELSFIYDILHTKAMYKHCTLGCVLQCSSLVSIIAAFVAFHHLDMQKYASKDILITYILFGAGLTFEVTAAFLRVFSDWTVVSLRKKGWGKVIARAIIIVMKMITSTKGKSRWSRTIGHYNLIGLCLRDRYTPPRTWIMKKLIKIKHTWDNIHESRLIPSQEFLVDCIIDQAKRRAPNLHIPNELVEARSNRGKKALEDHGQLETLKWSMNREFDECIILWHVATDICYYNDTSVEPTKNETERDVSWRISNYMVYLVTQQQLMMQVGYGQTRFEVTCAVVKKIFKGKGKLDNQTARKVIMDVLVDPNVHIEDELMNDMEDMPNNANKELGKKVIKDIRNLVLKLQGLEPKLKWQLLSEIWIEMLGYAAIHCDSNQHVKSLSRGGELLTAVWLLMAHLGVVEEQKMQQFQSDEIV